MPATAPTVSGMSLLELVNRMLRTIGLPPLSSVSDLSYTGGINGEIERFIYDFAKDYFLRWVDGGVVKYVTYSVTGTTINVRTLAATSPATTTFNMAAAIRGVGDYEGRNFTLRGDGLILENGKPKTFGTEVVTLDIATGPIFNTSATDDAAAWRQWFEDINPGVKVSMASELLQKWRVFKAPDPTMDNFLERQRVRDQIGVEKEAQNKADTINAPPTFQPASINTGGRGG